MFHIRSNRAPPANRLRELREQRDWSQDHLAHLAGTTKAQISKLERGARRLTLDWMIRLAEVLAVDPQDLLADRDQTPPKPYERMPSRTGSLAETGDYARAPLAGAPLVGYVGAGAEVFPIDDHSLGDGLEIVETPLATGRPMVAVRVRGQSMMPTYFDGDILFFSRDYDFIQDVCIYNVCIVKVHDGPTLVKQILPGSLPGRFTLISFNDQPRENVEIEWAAPVDFVDQRGRRMRSRLR